MKNKTKRYIICAAPIWLPPILITIMCLILGEYETAAKLTGAVGVLLFYCLFIDFCFFIAHKLYKDENDNQ